MDKISLDIDNLGMNFEGVARKDGKVFFVPYTLVGEKVYAEIVEDKPKFAKCNLVELQTLSSDRVEPLCPYFFSCGGCDVQHINYNKQLEYKTKHIKETLIKVAGINNDVLDIEKSANNFFYRNKGAFPICLENGETHIGMFKVNTHEIIPISQCFLMNDCIMKAYKIVQDYLKENNIKGYDFNNFSGDAKFLVVRSIENQTIVCLVVTKTLPNLNQLYEKLKASLDSVGLILNFNTHKNQTILGEEYKIINGITNISLNEFGVKYNVGIASFLQINNDIKNKIYNKVIEELKDDIVIDAYAGAGLLSATLSSKAKKVYSVEIVKEASISAINLIKANNINNVEVVNGDCGKVLPQIIKKINSGFSVVLDPARIGCDKNVIDIVKNANKIVYISCNPIALAKDLKELTTTHSIDYIQPYDMFPQTKHCEVLTCLTKRT